MFYFFMRAALAFAIFAIFCLSIHLVFDGDGEAIKKIISVSFAMAVICFLSAGFFIL